MVRTVVPFWYQITEYDCGPTSIINALSYLYYREQIPTAVVQKIYVLSLDCNKSRGTTNDALALISHYFNTCRTSTFSPRAHALFKNDVVLHKDCEIASSLNAGGVAVLMVKHFGTYWHYILALSIVDGWLYAFDPYLKPKKYSRPGSYEYLEPEEPESVRKPNIRIKVSWLHKKTDLEPFSLGTIEERFALTIQNAVSE